MSELAQLLSHARLDDQDEADVASVASGEDEHLDPETKRILAQFRGRFEDISSYEAVKCLTQIVLEFYPLAIKGKVSFEEFVEVDRQIVEAYKQRSFLSIKRLHESFQQDQTQPALVFARDQESEFHWCKASFQSFSQNYIGADQDCLLRALDNYVTAQSVYNRTISIVQSSGCGKSRLVDKASEERFAFPMNIREALPEGLKTYPPADINDLVGYFEPNPLDTNAVLYAQYAAFLMEMFKEAETIVRSWQLSSHAEIAKKWHDYLAEDQTLEATGPNRQAFYRSVVKSAKNVAASTSDFEILKAPLQESIRRLKQTLYPPQRVVLRNGQKTTKRCAFFIYIDEAHTLTKDPKGSGRDRSAYHALGHVLRWVRSQPFFTLFLSTNSKLRSLAPTPSLHPSTRDWGFTTLFAPYTELPFDIFSHGICSQLDEGQVPVTLDRMCSVEEMARFGRPLWYSQYRHKVDENDNIFVFAMGKLNPKQGAQKEPKDVHATLAALDIRIQLSFDVSREVARSRVSTLVESYMRVVYAVPEHREFMHSGYPSEPVLAEVAARLLNLDDSSGASTAHPPIAYRGPTILNDAYGDELLARGERGEAVGRLLVTIAHDRVLMRDPAPFEDEAVFHVPIKVVDFLKSLFNGRYHKAILGALPVATRDGADTLQIAYKDAYISFSHFAQAGDSKVVQIKYLSKLLLRGAAFNCQAQQRSVDLIIPVFFGNPERDSIHPLNTSVLQIQIKNRRHVPAGDVYVNPTISDPNREKPVLSLFLELGASESSVYVETRNHPETRSGVAFPEANHYLLVAKGCSSSTYSAIPPGYDEKYADLLRSSVLSDDFPRKENIGLLQRQKPAFYAEPSSSWDW
ncbi:uncharacterized protein EI90DRAFT_3292349 [Cantharellus anzutake]|uniref:uncharacterized protein n=1 Tax=Cantharellus anzutake TaxID=1750568 RepID=UPI0019046FEC|nr:uncharacterized protein EI90DRAFT_3292349 [Cantharellus anzutake]KAF8323466.1 hypothetical protein EI90DRAFT_3292349 [Cantharellus anzutake]